jgi:hypothetical protein
MWWAESVASNHLPVAGLSQILTENTRRQLITEVMRPLDGARTNPLENGALVGEELLSRHWLSQQFFLES